MREDRWIVHAATILLLALTLLVLAVDRVGAVEPVTGTASHYGPGTGVATPWCTWTKRHATGCGVLRIQSHQTGLVVFAPVIDWCQCYRNDPGNERVVDMQWSVVAALGLDRADGLYAVTIWRAGGGDGLVSYPPLPDTAMR